MSSFSNYLENATLNHFFGNEPVYLALFTAAPGEAGGGTEVSGGGYARQMVSYGAANAGVILNATSVSFTASGGGYGTVNAIGVFDAATGGNLLYSDGITPATINDTDTLSFEPGDLQLSLD